MPRGQIVRHRASRASAAASQMRALVRCAGPRRHRRARGSRRGRRCRPPVIAAVDQPMGRAVRR